MYNVKLYSNETYWSNINQLWGLQLLQIPSLSYLTFPYCIFLIFVLVDKNVLKLKYKMNRHWPHYLLNNFVLSVISIHPPYNLFLKQVLRYFSQFVPNMSCDFRNFSLFSTSNSCMTPSQDLRLVQPEMKMSITWKKRGHFGGYIQ